MKSNPSCHNSVYIDIFVFFGKTHSGQRTLLGPICAARSILLEFLEGSFLINSNWQMALQSLWKPWDVVINAAIHLQRTMSFCSVFNLEHLDQNMSTFSSDVSHMRYCAYVNVADKLEKVQRMSASKTLYAVIGNILRQGDTCLYV